MKKINLINVAVYATILGYWYNLPVISTTIFGGYNEFRLYDITFFVLIVKAFSKSCIKDIILNLSQNRPLKYFYRFSIWASIMIIPTIIFSAIKSNFINIGMSIMFLYHLWGFLLLVIFITTFYDNFHLEKLIRWFLLLSTIHLFLYYSQVSGLVGHLWNERYVEVYGEKAYSGTLGPNRITPGMMTLFGFVLSLFNLLRKSCLRYIKLISSINVVLSVPAILMIGSRTTFISLIIFISVYVVFYRKRLIPLFLLLLPALIYLYGSVLNPKQAERIETNIQKNQVKLLRGNDIEDITVVEGYSNIGNGRWQILNKYVPYLLDNPQIIPFGSGFNNRIIASSTGAASAHNIYLSLINELGLLGLFFYLTWLFSYFSLIRSYKKEKFEHVGLGFIVSILVAMIISLTAGEHLYVYRPCFAILGSFLFVITSITLVVEEDYENQIDTEYDF